jgi:hypothetical protein
MQSLDWSRVDKDMAQVGVIFERSNMTPEAMVKEILGRARGRPFQVYLQEFVKREGIWGMTSRNRVETPERHRMFHVLDSKVSARNNRIHSGLLFPSTLLTLLPCVALLFSGFSG